MKYKRSYPLKVGHIFWNNKKLWWKHKIGHSQDDMNDTIQQDERTWNITEQTLSLLQVLLLF